MGHTPQPRWDKSKRAWRVQYRGRRYYLGRDEADAYRKFARIVGGDVTVAISTVGEAYSQWQARNGNNWTKYLFARWHEFGGNVTLDAVNNEHFVSYARWLGREYKPETVRHCLRYALTVCRWCVEHGFMDCVPAMPKTPMPIRRPKDIDPDTLTEAFAKLHGRSKPLLEFILETGCRPGEGRLLRWDEVDLRRNVAVLTRHKTGKRTGRVRTIVLTPAAKATLMSVPTAKARTGYVFLSRLGKPFTHGGVSMALIRAGIGSVYSLRHTRAQTMLDAGISAEVVAEWLGHANLATVKVYCHITASRLQEVAKSLPSPLQSSSAGEESPDSAAASESPAKSPPSPRKSGSVRRRTAG